VTAGSLDDIGASAGDSGDHAYGESVLVTEVYAMAADNFGSSGRVTAARYAQRRSDREDGDMHMNELSDALPNR
jgi:hypothetical protein